MSFELMYRDVRPYVHKIEYLIDNGYAPMFNNHKRYLQKRVTRCCRCNRLFKLHGNRYYRRPADKCIKRCLVNGLLRREVFKCHIHKNNLKGLNFYAQARVCRCIHGCGVFSLKCNSVFTDEGMELARVTVLNDDLEAAYDYFVKPEGKILDLMEQKSGVGRKMLRRATKTLSQVQEDLSMLFCEDSIIIGKNLFRDLSLLNFYHDALIDASLVDSEYGGLPRFDEVVPEVKLTRIYNFYVMGLISCLTHHFAHYECKMNWCCLRQAIKCMIQVGYYLCECDGRIFEEVEKEYDYQDLVRTTEYIRRYYTSLGYEFDPDLKNLELHVTNFQLL